LRKLNIGNMKSFQKSQKLKQVALMAIAVQSDPNDIKELKEIFQELDNNGDGSISFDELQAGLGKRENGAQLLEVLRAADTDNSGTINYTGKLFVRFI
jgi:calcium-dependent protein kinase